MTQDHIFNSDGRVTFDGWDRVTDRLQVIFTCIEDINSPRNKSRFDAETLANLARITEAVSELSVMTQPPPKDPERQV